MPTPTTTSGQSESSCATSTAASRTELFAIRSFREQSHVERRFKSSER